MIIAQTPFRISFFGGGTDYPGFFQTHGGCTLSTTVNQYAYILTHPVSECFGYKLKASYAQTETVETLEQIQHPLIRETLRHLGLHTGVEVDHVADLPGRTGLGASSSFTLGLLNALHTMRGETPSRDQLAREAIHIERTLVGDPGGWQDQYAAAFGGLNRIDYTADGVRVTPLQLAAGRMEALESHLIVFYLGMVRSSNPILKEQEKRTGNNTAALLRLKDMTAQAQQILQSAADLRDFGALLDDAWRLKQTLAPDISNNTIDAAYETARQAGALGGKILGAGGGGFLLVFAEPRFHPQIIARLDQLHRVPLRFETGGARILYGGERT